MGRQQAQTTSSVNVEVGNLICLACMRNEQAVGCPRLQLTQKEEEVRVTVSGQNMTMMVSTVI